MNILEAVRAGLTAIWSNKIRSFLTMLGMIIGVGSVIILVSIGKGVYNNVADIVQGMGANLVFIVSGDVKGLSQSGKGTYMANPANFIKGDILTTDDVANISQMPEVEHITPMNIVAGSLQYKNKRAFPIVMGVKQAALQTIRNITLDKGRMLKDDDDKVMVLSDRQVELLFGDKNFNPLGKKINLDKQEFEIIGTIKQAKQQTNIISSDFDNIALIPFETANRINGSTQIMRILIKIKDNFDAKTAADKIKTLMLKNHSQDEFSVLTQEDMLDMMSSILNIMTLMITAIASISLIVGGVGIMNIMLVSVSERTREIGIRKAIGATDAEILKQFLIEAIILSLIGGGIGLAIAYSAGWAFKLKTSISPVIDLSIISLAVGISVGVGIISGLFPAIRAAKKNPVDALRYE